MKLVESKQCITRAKAIFEEWKTIIETEIPSSRVEHIGSTAIYGALTKGDIDLYVEVPEDIHAKAVSTIETMGFTIKRDTHRDPYLCMLKHQNIDDLAVQVVARGSKYTFFLDFRDALNCDQHLVEQYNALKSSCIDATPEQYRERKSQFIRGVLIGSKNPSKFVPATKNRA